MSAASPTSLPAVNAPHPGTASSDGTSTATRPEMSAFELVGFAGEFTDTRNFTLGQAGDDTVVAFEELVDGCERLVSVQ